MALFFCLIKFNDGKWDEMERERERGSESARQKSGEARRAAYNDATSDRSHILHITSFPNFPFSVCTTQWYSGGAHTHTFLALDVSVALVAFNLIRVFVRCGVAVVIGLKAQTISIAMIHLVSSCTHSYIGISQISYKNYSSPVLARSLSVSFCPLIVYINVYYHLQFPVQY